MGRDGGGVRGVKGFQCCAGTDCVAARCHVRSPSLGIANPPFFRYRM
jgi:hypothetical protein